MSAEALRQGTIDLGPKANLGHAAERDEAEGEEQSRGVQVGGLRDERQEPAWRGALGESSDLGSV